MQLCDDIERLLPAVQDLNARLLAISLKVKYLDFWPPRRLEIYELVNSHPARPAVAAHWQRTRCAGMQSTGASCEVVMTSSKRLLKY